MPFLNVIAVSFFTLGFAAAVTIAMLPIGLLQRWEWFPESQETSLWLLLLTTLVFGLVVLAIRSERYPRRLLTAGGITLLVIAVLLGVEIFLTRTCLIQACGDATRPPGMAAMVSLWLLFIGCTLLGVGGVYVAKRRAEEDERRAEAARPEERPTCVRIVRR